MRLAPCLALLAVGCGYTSEYVAPADGRPRAVWHDNKVVVERAGAPASSQCAADIGQLTDTSTLRERRPQVRRPEGGYWVPTYYGPQIVVVSRGMAPILPHPPVFLPSLLGVRPGVAMIGPLPVPVLRVGGLGGGSGSRGGSGDLGKAAVVLAVVALVVLPAVDLGLAIAPAESAGPSAQAIDQVNAWNDLLRSPGTACSYDQAAGGAP
jgi:hypothetical protein